MIDAQIKRPTRVAIVVDNPKRDLRGAVLIAYQLLRRGAQAYIVPMYQQGYDVPLLAPDVVLANYVRTHNAPMLATFRSNGSKVAVLDTEGGILSEAGLDSPENWARSFKQNAFGKFIDRYFFWGERVRAAFELESGLAADQLNTTGCPRYDLCAPAWRPMLRHERQDFILVNTNFSAVNPLFTRSHDEELKIFCELGWSEDYVRALFDALKEVHPKYLNAIESLARSNPDRTILVRPHPFENADVYLKRFKHLGNVVVDGRGDVLNVIANAYCVVHLNCGTSVEAALLKKAPISMEFLNNETMRRHAPLPSSLSYLARSEQELNDLVRNAVANPAAYAASASTNDRITPWFHILDGQAGGRVAEGVLAVGASHRAARSIKSSIRGSRPEASVLQSAQGIASNILGSRFISAARNMVRPQRKAKNISAGEVEKLLRAYASCEGSAHTATVGYAPHPLTRLPLASLSIEAA